MKIIDRGAAPHSFKNLRGKVTLHDTIPTDSRLAWQRIHKKLDDVTLYKRFGGVFQILFIPLIQQVVLTN